MPSRTSASPSTADRPEIFTIIGESGSGKTTLARMILNSMAPTAGSIRFRGEDLRDIAAADGPHAFMRQVQPIFQNPFEAFNPLKRVDRYLFRRARSFTERGRRTEAERRVGRGAAQGRACRSRK